MDDNFPEERAPRGQLVADMFLLKEIFATIAAAQDDPTAWLTATRDKLSNGAKSILGNGNIETDDPSEVVSKWAEMEVALTKIEGIFDMALADFE